MDPVVNHCGRGRCVSACFPYSVCAGNCGSPRRYAACYFYSVVDPRLVATTMAGRFHRCTDRRNCNWRDRLGTSDREPAESTLRSAYALIALGFIRSIRDNGLSGRPSPKSRCDTCSASRRHSASTASAKGVFEASPARIDLTNSRGIAPKSI